MTTKKQAGFTLIEIMLVMAISSMLAVIAWNGQRGLRARAQFDASVDKVVAGIAGAYTEARAGVNIIGDGNGTTNNCAGTPVSGWVFAGIAWVATGPGTIRVDYYKVNPDPASAASEVCKFDSRAIELASLMEINISNPLHKQGGTELFIRTDDGGLAVCGVQDTFAVPDVAPFFKAGSCGGGGTVAQLPLHLTDADGHESDVLIDGSGLAQRLN